MRFRTNVPHQTDERQSEESDEHHARRQPTLTEDQLAEIFISRQQQRPIATRKIQNGFIGQPGVHFGDRLYLMAIPP